jgi:hypothetical protein
LNVYDLLGRQIETIVDEYKQAGVHAISWEASAYPSGVYFARLQAGNMSKSIKMVLLK